MVTAAPTSRSRRRAIATAVAVAGELALALSLAHLTGATGCGVHGQSACADGMGLAVLGLVVGLCAAILGTILGGRVWTFIGMFAAVGAGGLIGALGGDPEMRTFGIVFFGGFLLLAGAMLPAAIVLRRKAGSYSATRARLLATGERGTGTVTAVRDTGVTINEDPGVEISLRIEPDFGAGTFEGTLRTIVSRVGVPRPGDRLRVVFDRTDPAGVMLEPASA